MPVRYVGVVGFVAVLVGAAVGLVVPEVVVLCPGVVVGVAVGLVVVVVGRVLVGALGLGVPPHAPSAAPARASAPTHAPVVGIRLLAMAPPSARASTTSG
jgi:hypothetical protein